MNNNQPPLTGVTVAELCVAIAGPAASGLLGDYGASIIKIEQPQAKNRGGNSILAGIPKLSNYDDSPQFYQDNRNKKSVILDLHDKIDCDAFEKILSKSDVYISNLRNGALEKLGPYGYTPEQVLKRHPHIVATIMTGYGRKGPDVNKPGYEGSGFWARSTLAYQHSGSHNGETYPPIIGSGVGDHTTALAAVGGICAALFSAKMTGKGRIVETSLLRAGMYTQGWAISNTFARRLKNKGDFRPFDREKMANPLYGVYKAKNAMFFFIMPDSQRFWKRFCQGMDMGFDGNDKRFATAKDRRINYSILQKIIEDKLMTKTFEEWEKIFNKYDLWYQKVQTYDDLIQDPMAQPGFTEIPRSSLDIDEGVEKIVTVSPPVDFDGEKHRTRDPVPIPGFHTAEVLKHVGLNQNEIEIIMSKNKMLTKPKL